MRGTILAYFLIFGACFAEGVTVQSKKFNIEFGLGAAQSNFNAHTNADSIVKWRDLNGIDFKFGIDGRLTPTSSITANINIGSIKSGEVSDDDMQNYELLNEDYGAPCGTLINCGIYSKTRSLKGTGINAEIILSSKISQQLNLRLGIKYKSLALEPEGVYQLYVGKDRYGALTPQLTVDPTISIQKLNMSVLGPSLGIEHFFQMEKADLGVKFDLFIPYSGTIEFSNWSLSGKTGVYDSFDVKIGTGIDLELYTKIKYEKFYIKYYTYFNYFKLSNVTATRFAHHDGITTATHGAKNLIYTKIGGGISILF